MDGTTRQTVISVDNVRAVPKPPGHDTVFATVRPELIKGKSVRGGVVVVVAQAVKFVITTGSSMILARLLSPQDFGLQGMVLAVTGFLSLFGDLGLGMATIQRDDVTHEQSSTLFWINVAIGTALGLLTAALAPVLVAVYHEPLLLWITFVLAANFLIGSLGAQHGALLMRSMRYFTRAKVELSALVISVAIGVLMAALGFGYWALIAMSTSSTIALIAGLWLSVRWLPGMPRRECGLWSMVHFGGTVTLNNLVVYLAYNTEKFLLGRYWGASALGLYGRAYSLVNLPNTQLHASMFAVAFPALSRLQGDPHRLRESFLKGYSILLSFTIPLTVACLFFADEIIRVLLGQKWIETIPIFRLLVPTVLVFGLINPFGWFLTASGRVVRSLNIAFLIAPSVILGIMLGLPHGPKGVALAFSVVMVLLTLPVIAWIIYDTGITFHDLWETMKRPVFAGLAAAGVGLALKLVLGVFPLVLRMVLGVGVTLGVYAAILLFVLGQRHLYATLVAQIIQRVRPRQTQTPPV